MGRPGGGGGGSVFRVAGGGDLPRLRARRSRSGDSRARPAGLLRAIREIVRSQPAVTRGTIRAVRGEYGARLTASGEIDDGRLQAPAQRVRVVPDLEAAGGAPSRARRWARCWASRGWPGCSTAAGISRRHLAAIQSGTFRPDRSLLLFLLPVGRHLHDVHARVPARAGAVRPRDLGRVRGVAAAGAGRSAGLGVPGRPDAPPRSRPARRDRRGVAGVHADAVRRQLRGHPASWALYALFAVAVGGLADAFAVARVRAGAVYGRLRLWGSVGYVVAAVAVGALLSARGRAADRLVPIAMWLTLGCAFFAATRLRGEGDPAARPRPADVLALLARSAPAPAAGDRGDALDLPDAVQRVLRRVPARPRPSAAVVGPRLLDRRRDGGVRPDGVSPAAGALSPVDAAGGGVRGQRRALAGDRGRPRAVGAHRPAGAARHDLRHVLERGDRAGRGDGTGVAARDRPGAADHGDQRRRARSATRSPAGSTTRTARGCCSCSPRSASSRRSPS